MRFTGLRKVCLTMMFYVKHKNYNKHKYTIYAYVYINILYYIYWFKGIRNWKFNFLV